jgi:hypothetical protein
MTQRLSTSQHAAPGERFAHNAFDSQVGSTVPLRIEGSVEAAEATVVAAAVSDDGTAVTFTLDVPDGTIPAATLTGLSLSAE